MELDNITHLEQMREELRQSLPSTAISTHPDNYLHDRRKKPSELKSTKPCVVLNTNAREIVRYHCQGWKAKDIANKLHCSVQRVDKVLGSDLGKWAVEMELKKVRETPEPEAKALEEINDLALRITRQALERGTLPSTNVNEDGELVETEVPITPRERLSTAKDMLDRSAKTAKRSHVTTKDETVVADQETIDHLRERFEEALSERAERLATAAPSPLAVGGAEEIPS